MAGYLEKETTTAYRIRDLVPISGVGDYIRRTSTVRPGDWLTDTETLLRTGFLAVYNSAVIFAGITSNLAIALTVYRGLEKIANS
jgi:hypothetical protein